MEVRKPTIRDYGLYAEHDQQCAVLPGEPAVYECGVGIFHPSWRAMAQGYRLVQGKSLIQRFVLFLFFDEPGAPRMQPTTSTSGGHVSRNRLAWAVIAGITIAGVLIWWM